VEARLPSDRLSRPSAQTLTIECGYMPPPWLTSSDTLLNHEVHDESTVWARSSIGFPEVDASDELGAMCRMEYTWMVRA